MGMEFLYYYAADAVNPTPHTKVYEEMMRANIVWCQGFGYTDDDLDYGNCHGEIMQWTKMCPHADMWIDYSLWNDPNIRKLIAEHHGENTVVHQTRWQFGKCRKIKFGK